MEITKKEWQQFIDKNYVSNRTIHMIAIRIINSQVQSNWEIAIYKEHSERVEKMICNLKKHNEEKLNQN